MLAVEEIFAGFHAIQVPVILVGPLLVACMSVVKRWRIHTATIRVLTVLNGRREAEIDDLRKQRLMASRSSSTWPLASTSLPIVEAAGQYIIRWQESQPMTPEAVAGVCQMVIDHLHLTIKDLNDEHVATMILTCCEVLDQMRAVAEDDQETIDAAREAWKAQFE